MYILRLQEYEVDEARLLESIVICAIALVSTYQFGSNRSFIDIAKKSAELPPQYKHNHSATNPFELYGWIYCKFDNINELEK